MLTELLLTSFVVSLQRRDLVVFHIREPAMSKSQQVLLEHWIVGNDIILMNPSCSGMELKVSGMIMHQLLQQKLLSNFRF